MKNVAFHSNQLGIRGTEVALYDYAHYNEAILGNKSFIVSDKNNDLQTLKKFQNRFDVFLYDNFSDSYKFIQNNNIKHGYFIKAGNNDSKLFPNIKNFVHAVFQEKDVHGDYYAYVSKWLAEKMGMPDNYLPHIVNLPEPQKNFREQLKISKDSIVIGRHGGYNEFDLPFVHSAIYNILAKRKDLVFLFMNTKPFGPEHSNIIFVEGTYNNQNKSNFINTCDYMLHARHRGESFGLAIAEFLFHNKPVISWNNGWDLNHTIILKDKGLWYNNQQDLESLLNRIKQNDKIKEYYNALVKEFSPQNVMKQFDLKFLSK
jgi:hypothetical protein